MTGCVIASCGVVVGMWLERFLIIVLTLSHKYPSYSWGPIARGEILLLVATFGAMGLLYAPSRSSCRSSRSGSSVGEQPELSQPQSRTKRRRSGESSPMARHRGLRLYAEPSWPRSAFTALRRAGVPEKEITVISAEPFEAFEFSQRDHSLTMFRLAAVGGLFGFIGSVLLVTGTSRAWPINVGGMPNVAWWPYLVIIFEMTMLSAILTTVVSRWSRRGCRAAREVAVRSGSVGRQDSSSESQSRPIGRPRRSGARSTRAERSS
jgi:hypothetical protein